MIYANIDNVWAHTTEEQEKLLKDRGYENLVWLKGKPRGSELIQHTRIRDRIGVVAFTNANRTHAYVLLDDNTLVHGCFFEQNENWNLT